MGKDVILLPSRKGQRLETKCHTGTNTLSFKAFPETCTHADILLKQEQFHLHIAKGASVRHGVCLLLTFFWYQLPTDSEVAQLGEAEIWLHKNVVRF